MSGNMDPATVSFIQQLQAEGQLAQYNEQASII